MRNAHNMLACTAGHACAQHAFAHRAMHACSTTRLCSATLNTHWVRTQRAQLTTQSTTHVCNTVRQHTRAHTCTTRSTRVTQHTRATQHTTHTTCNTQSTKHARWHKRPQNVVPTTRSDMAQHANWHKIPRLCTPDMPQHDTTHAQNTQRGTNTPKTLHPDHTRTRHNT